MKKLPYEEERMLKGIFIMSHGRPDRPVNAYDIADYISTKSDVELDAEVEKVKEEMRQNGLWEQFEKREGMYK